jgi:hypothetical protein
MHVHINSAPPAARIRNIFDSRESLICRWPCQPALDELLADEPLRACTSSVGWMRCLRNVSATFSSCGLKEHHSTAADNFPHPHFWLHRCRKVWSPIPTSPLRSLGPEALRNRSHSLFRHTPFSFRSVYSFWRHSGCTLRPRNCYASSREPMDLHAVVLLSSWVSRQINAVRQNDFPLRRVLWCGEVLPTPALMYWMERSRRCAS